VGCLVSILYSRKVCDTFFGIMPIRLYQDKHRFDAETIRLLGTAFETAIACKQGDAFHGATLELRHPGVFEQT
jgi:hypothetical protein